MKRATAFLLVVACVGPANCPAAEEAAGRSVFNTHCMHCHAPGEEHPGTGQLTRTRGKDRGVLEERDDLEAEYVRLIVRHGIRAMPAFLPSTLTDADLEALTNYLSR